MSAAYFPDRLAGLASTPVHGAAIALVVAAVLASVMGLSIPGLSRRWSVEGKHIFITGGSQGLGLSLAELVASKGADVTICARATDKLEKATEQIKKSARSSSQKVAYISADVSSFEAAKAALATASEAGRAGQVGRVPDAVFACAGAATPGYFLEQSQPDFERGIKLVYMTALATSHAAASLFVRHDKRDAKIVLVGSTVSLMGLIGYASYSPMKWAIRGLAECLRSEFNLYGIRIHAYFPGTILSPGYVEENKTKPDITKELEGGESDGLTPEQCARGLLKGVERGQFYITTDLISELVRAGSASCGTVPGNNWLLDRAKAAICQIALPVWRIFIADPSIKKQAKQHRAALRFPDGQ